MKLIFYTLDSELDPEEIKKTQKFLPVIVTNIAKGEFGDFRVALGLIATEDDMPKILELAGC